MTNFILIVFAAYKCGDLLEITTFSILTKMRLIRLIPQKKKIYLTLLQIFPIRMSFRLVYSDHDQRLAYWYKMGFSFWDIYNLASDDSSPNFP